jgi:hypothetical protein
VESEPRCIVSLPSFPPTLWLRPLFSLVQPSSHLTLCLYAKRSAHPDILIGTHEIPIPLASQRGPFCLEFPFVQSIDISRADIPCVLENGVGEAAPSTQPVTLYITVNITPPNLYNGPPSIPTEDDNSPAEQATIPGRNQFPAPGRLLLLSHHQPVETGNTMPQNREEVSPTMTNTPRFALHRAEESMKRIVPIDQSNTWEMAVGRIKWVMDTLGPIAEVRVMPF